MTEHGSQFSKFDPAAAGEILGVEPQPRRDPAHGEGYEFPLGQAEVVVYPERAVVEVKTDRGRHELLGMSGYSLREDAVVFEQAGTQGADDRPTMRFRMQANGVPSYYPVVRARLTSETPPTAQPPVAVTKDAPARPTRRSDGTPTAAEGQEVPEQHLQGFIAKQPWYNHNPEQPIGTFLLGVPGERDRPTWKHVVVFNELVKSLRDDLASGRLKVGSRYSVDVTGRPVVHVEPKPDGGVRKREEFHATAVTPMPRGKRSGRPSR